MSNPRLWCGLWLLITFGSILFFLVSAWSYREALLSQPFLGSTVQPGVTSIESVRLGLERWGLTPTSYANLLVIEQAVITLACCILGVLIFWRRPSDPLAWGMGLILVLMGTQIPVQAAAIGQLFPGWGFLGFTTNQVGTAVSLVLIWIFPDGRFVPSWSRWTFILILLLGAFATVYPDTVLAPILVPMAITLIICGILAQIYRYSRVSDPVGRQQTKWVLFALMIAPATWAISALLIPSLFPVLTQSSENAAPYNLLRITLGNFANLLIPLTIGLSILRYRLWHIDVILRKTLLYGSLTALLGLVYFGMVVFLQEFFGRVSGQGNSPLAMVISTLAIAALFHPLRVRLQNFIDRRFFRQKYNSGQALAAFAQTARGEVEIERLSAELVKVVQETLQPLSVQLLFRKAGKGSR